MFRQRLLPVLVLAVTVGLVTSYLVYSSVKAGTDPNRDTSEVTVAAVNISIGEALTPQHMKLVRWPKASLPPAAIATPKTVEGRVAKVSFFPGEPILEAKLAASGPGGLMTMMVPPGKRAVSIKLDEAAQKSGFLLPNSRVDVLVTMARNAGGGKESRLVLQDVTVLAADQSVETKDNRPVTMTTVTLALTPAEAERLALAQNEGKVNMAIRNMTDGSLVTTPGVTTNALLGSPAPAPKPAEASPKPAGPRKPTQVAAKPKPAPAAPPAPAVAQAPVPAPTVAPAPVPVPTHTVAVIRGVNASQQVFVKDTNKGWVQSSGEDAAKPRPKP